LITVRCFASLADAGFLRDAVNALNRRCARPDPFSTFEFFENYLRHDEAHPAGRGMQLWFLAALRDGQLIGYLPLKQVTRATLWSRVTTLSFLVTHDTDRPHLVAGPDDLPAVSVAMYEHVLARRRDWDFLEFQQQDANSSLFPPPTTVDLSGHLVRLWPSLPNCTIHVRWHSLREYVASLDKKFRSNLDRQMRHLLAAGEVELLSSSDRAVTPALLELYRGIEPRSWKSLADATIGRHPRRIAYFEGLLDPRQPMQVSIQILLLDGLPIAGLINGAYLGQLYALHIVYDEAFHRVTPGSAMLLMGMRQAIEGGYTAFNLLSGFGYYKARWLADATDTQIVQIYRIGTLPYWRRRIGDWRRALLPSGSKPLHALFNPVRRNVAQRAQVQVDSVRPRVNGPPAEDRQRWTHLIERARAGPGECLTPAALAAVMPIGVAGASGGRRPRTH